MGVLRGVRLRPSRGAVVVALLGLAFLVSSRTTGSGWLTILVSLAVAIVVLGAILPLAGVLRVTVRLDGPADAMVGRRLEMHASVSGWPASVRLRLLEPASSWVGLIAPEHGMVVARPARRGVLASASIEVSTAAPFGLVWAHRRLEAPLARPIDVAPRPTPVGLSAAATTSGEGETAVGGRHSEGETVRTVREYRDGDPLRMIHWAASARRDNLVVKELEAPQTPALVVSLDLRGDPEVAERHASLAAGYVQAGLRSGMPVQLHTMENGGQQSGWVGSTLEAGRRLARAVPGRVTALPPTGRATMVHLGPR